MTGWRLLADDENSLEVLRRIDPGVGTEGILMRASDLNKWLERMQSWGNGVEFRLESKEMDESEFYGLDTAVLAGLGLKA